jgi:transposase-like protein
MPYNDNLPHDEAIVAPAHCPTCQSRDVTTASKVVNAASYWRCRACGEVWNVKRLGAAGGRFSYAPPFRR